MTSVSKSIPLQLMTLPLTLLVTFALVSGSVLARSTPEPVSQSGPFLTVTSEPDTTTEFSVALGNAGVAPVSARTFAADIHSLVNGGFEIGKGGDPVTGPTTWLDCPIDSLELVPNQRLERTFPISIPAAANPTQYTTGIVLQTAEPFSVGDSPMLRVTTLNAAFAIAP